MSPERARDLLAVWDESWAPLPDCRRALERSATDPQAAIASLRLPSIAMPWKPASRDLLKVFKKGARSRGDWKERSSSEPLDLLWAADRTLERPAVRFVVPWVRHRFFVDMPSERFIDGVIGGYVRVKSAPGAPVEQRDAATLSAFDARYVVRQLVRASVCQGVGYTVELLGGRGAVSAAGPDAPLEAALRSLESQTSVTDLIDHRRVRPLFDRYPDRGQQKPGLHLHERSLLRAEQLLVDLELEAPTPEELAVCRSIAAASAGTSHLVTTRSFRAAGAKPEDVLDRVLLEHDVLPASERWREVSREEALSGWAKVATPIALEPLLASLTATARFFRNRADGGNQTTLWSPLVSFSSPESGAAAIDDRRVTMVFAGFDDA